MTKKQLTFFITRTSVHVAEVLCSNGDIVRTAQQSFDTLNENNSKELLASFIRELNWDESYDEYSLSWVSPTATLVPSRIFDASTPHDILNLVLGDKVSKAEVDYNRLAELDMVNVFTMPNWVKSFFIIKYPKISIYHDYTIRIRSLFKQSTYKPTVGIHLHKNQFMLLIANKQELVLANHFSYQSVEDLVYYLSYALQQQKLIDQKVTIFTTALSEEQLVLLAELKQVLTTGKIIPNTTVASTELAFKNQLICE